MKKMIAWFVIVFSVIGFSSAGAEEYLNCKLAEGVYIDAEIPNIVRENIAVYPAETKAFSVEEIAAILMKKEYGNWCVDENKYQMTLTSEYERLTIPSSSGQFFGAFSVSYTNEKEYNKYSWLDQSEFRKDAGLPEEHQDLTFMSKEEAIEICNEKLRRFNPGFEPQCSYVYAYAADDLNIVRDWLYENDAMYHSFCDSQKIAWVDEFQTEDEMYTLGFVFSLDDIVIYNNSEMGIQPLSENAAPQANKVFAEIVLNREGIIYFYLSDCIGLIGEAEVESIIDVVEAAMQAAKTFDDVILTTPVLFNQVYLEYLPWKGEDASRTMRPAWCFCITMADDPQMDIFEVCRIDAVTGEVIR